MTRNLLSKLKENGGVLDDLLQTKPKKHYSSSQGDPYSSWSSLYPDIIRNSRPKPKVGFSHAFPPSYSYFNYIVPSV